MDRLKLLEKAEQLANSEISGVAALDDARYEELSELPDSEAIEILAHEFLQEAADYNFGK